MKLRLAILLTVFLFATPVFAQGDLFVGYSLGLVDLGTTETFNGFTVAGAGAISETIAIEGDFSFHTGSVPTGLGSLDIDIMTFAAGPRFTFDREGPKPYVHTLAGFSRLSAFGGSSTDFALILGGGVDVPAGDKVSLRFGVDYVPVFLSGTTANNIRVIAGVVFRFGE